MEEINKTEEQKCSFCEAAAEAKRLLEEGNVGNQMLPSIESSKTSGEFKDPVGYCMKAWKFLQLFIERQALYYSRKQEFAKSFADLPISEKSNTVMYSYEFYFKGDNISSVIARPLDPRLKYLEATIYRSITPGSNTINIKKLIQVGTKEYRRDQDLIQTGLITLYPDWKSYCF